MEDALGGKVQGNLYLSSKRKQGFRVHYDTHDVFAVHVMGEKTWFVFEGRADAPIAHPMFKGLPPEHHEQAKGKLWREVRLQGRATCSICRAGSITTLWPTTAPARTSPSA